MVVEKDSSLATHTAKDKKKGQKNGKRTQPPHVTERCAPMLSQSESVVNKREKGSAK
jgi:hypothetical protein